MLKFSNLWKSPVTTVIGIGLVVYALVGYWIGKFDWEPAAAILAAGLWGLGMRDPKTGGGQQIDGPMILLLLFLAMGCKTAKVANHSEVKDSTYVKVTVRTDTLRLPGAEIPYRVYVNCDSTGKAYLSRTKGGKAERHYNFSNGEAFNEISFDSTTGALDGYAGCDSLERLLEIRDSTIFNLRFEKTGTTITETVKETPIWNWMAMGAMGLIIFLMAIKLLAR